MLERRTRAILPPCSQVPRFQFDCERNSGRQSKKSNERRAYENTSAREIERKFLLKRLPDELTTFPTTKSHKDTWALKKRRSGRLRQKGVHSFDHIQKRQRRTREEREIRLSAEQFDALWPATAGRRLTKIRYEVPWKEHTIEIDIYRGRHDGLVVAEVEFADEKSCADFEPPDWMGEDVSGKSRYSNVALAHD